MLHSCTLGLRLIQLVLSLPSALFVNAPAYCLQFVCHFIRFDLGNTVVL